MSGVQSGTRLERLHQLQRAARLQRAHARWKQDHDRHDHLDALVRRITTEIEAEQIAAERAARARPAVAAAVRLADMSVQHRLEALGVTSHTVKEWAVQHGLLAAVVRGRVSGLLVDAYATAHQTQETPS